MAAHEMLLTNAWIVNEGKIFKGHLLTREGKIAEIFYEAGDTPLPQDVQVTDLEGLYLLPGVIDDQVHFREPGLTHKADIFTESRAAVAGGVTSFMEMPNTVPQTTTQKHLEEKFRIAAEKSLANYSFYMGATNDNLHELLPTDAGHVCGVKVFMGSSTGNMLVDHPESLTRIFRDVKLPIAVHCEDEATIQNNLQQAKELFGEAIPMGQHPVIRSHKACYLSSSLAVDLARKFGTRLHLLHLSTAREVELLDSTLPLENKQITGEVCVHHLWFTDADYPEKGGLIKWNPAVKSLADREALREALSNGIIDVVATDHAPHTLEEKQQPYLKCPSGGPMVQHTLVAMLELVHQKVYSLEQVVQFMCHNPAIAFRVKNRGFIRKGYAADLVAVDLNKPFTVSRDQLHFKCGWSPLEGTTLQSAVQYTFVNGVPVYKKGSFLDSYRGSALEFSR
jgi:dihydroorotase